MKRNGLEGVSNASADVGYLLKLPLTRRFSA